MRSGVLWIGAARWQSWASWYGTCAVRARAELARNASRRRHPFIEHLVVDGDGDAADLKLYNFGRQRRLNLSLLHLAHDR